MNRPGFVGGSNFQIGWSRWLARDGSQVAAPTRAKAITLPLLKRQKAARLKQIEAQREAVDAEINALIQGDPDLAQRFAILCSIPGIAEVSAAMLLIEMPERGSLH